MKHIRPFVFCIFTLVITCTVSHGQLKSGELAPIQMGAAKVNITPGVPLPLSGYDARETLITGIHDQLFATARKSGKNLTFNGLI